jgi:hypothetical protein
MRRLLLIPALALIAAAPKPAVTPSEIIAAAPESAWQTIPADDLLVMDLKKGGRVVIQLAPGFAPVHVANIRALAKANWWDKAAIYRVQDNYVVQWGKNESADPLPAAVVAKPPAEYARPTKGLAIHPLGYPDAYAPGAGFAAGWPIGYDSKSGTANLVHCYGYVGVGRDLDPDTGTGGELYGPQHRGRRAGDRRDRGNQQPSAGDGGARLLQGAHAGRADRFGAAGERHSGSRTPIVPVPGHEQRRLLRLCARAGQPQGRLLHPPGGRSRPLQCLGADQAHARRLRALRPPRPAGGSRSCEG